MKIILLPFEVESYAMSHLYKRLTKEGHIVYMMNADTWHFNDYFAQKIFQVYKELGVEHYYSLKDEYVSLQQKRKYSVDWEFLVNFENEYCVEKNLQQLIMTDHVYNCKSRRPYYHNVVSNEQRYYWVERQIKWIMKNLDDVKPDVIFTLERNYFIKNIIWQIAKKRNIRFLTLTVGRIDNRFFMSENFGYGGNSDFAIQLLDKKNDIIAEEYIESYKKSEAFSTYGFSITEDLVKNNRLAFFNIFLEMYRNIKFEFRHFYLHKPLKRIRFPRYMDYVESKAVGYHLRRFFNKCRYTFLRKVDFTQKLPARDFVYFPLHLLPESSTLTLSNEYYEEDIIRFVSSKLPINYRLVIKDNPMMVGDRPYRYYDELKKLPNVDFIDPLFPSKDIVKKCNAVIGISGTALLEAAMLGKITYAFGFPEFLDAIEFIGYADADAFVKSLSTNLHRNKLDYLHAYISYVKTEGIFLDWVELLYNYNSKKFLDSVNCLYNLLKLKLDE